MILQAALETTVLLCFCPAWSVANLRMVGTLCPEGKGWAFTSIILVGYAAGACAKWLSVGPGAAPLAVCLLYAVNGASVTMNLVLQWDLGTQRARRPADA